MNGLDLKLNRIREGISSNFKEIVYAILLSGSSTNRRFIEGWSDIDILVIFKDNPTFQDLLDVKHLIDDLVTEINCDIGWYFANLPEINNGKVINVYTDGKILQTLLQTSVKRDNILYCQDDNFPIVNFTSDFIKEFSLKNIYMFINRNRFNLIRENLNQSNIIKTVKKETRAIKTVFKLFSQYRSGIFIESPDFNIYKEVIKEGEVDIINGVKHKDVYDFEYGMSIVKLCFTILENLEKKI